MKNEIIYVTSFSIFLNSLLKKKLDQRFLAHSGIFLKRGQFMSPTKIQKKNQKVYSKNQLFLISV